MQVHELICILLDFKIVGGERAKIAGYNKTWDHNHYIPHHNKEDMALAMIAPPRSASKIDANLLCQTQDIRKEVWNPHTTIPIYTYVFPTILY